MSILAILFALIVLGLVWWAITSLLAAFGIGDPIATVVRVVFVVLVVLWIVSAVFGLGPGIHLRW